MAFSNSKIHKSSETRNAKHVVRQAHHPERRRRATRNLRSWLSIDLERMDYRKAWALQEKLIVARKEGLLQNDIVLFLEHPPVFTLGRRGGRECMLVSDAFLEKAGISIIQVERGGNITYHGPGQLVVYPIVDLQTARIKVVDFVSGLEDVMLQTVQNWGIAAERNDANRGIWVGPKKMGSIGIAVRRGISFHGLALNIQTDLTPFTWIQPCGLQDVQMTSMRQECDQIFSMQQVRAVLKKQFEAVFGIKFILKKLADLDAILENAASTSSV
jgi:lipoate-protein ligase B